MPLAADAETFLAQSMVATVATRSPRGRAFVTPLWFVAVDGRLHLVTGLGTRAIRNVAHDPAVVLLLHGELGGGPRRVLRVRGTARVRVGVPSWASLLRMARKYYLSPAAVASELRHVAQWMLRIRYDAQSTPAHLEIAPETMEFLDGPTSDPQTTIS
jgi:hypothetical protein